MGRDEEWESLLHDVLHEGDLDAFRRDLGARCRKALDRKRTPRHLWILPAAAAVLLGLLLALPDAPDEPPLAPRPPAPTSEPAYFVHTVPHPHGLLVSTVNTPSVETVRSMPVESVTVRTRSEADVGRVTSAEFLDLFEGIPCGLVRDLDGRLNLVFLRPWDRERFMGGTD
jgi:hypothetical protein